VARDDKDTCVYISKDALKGTLNCDAPKCVCLDHGKSMEDWVKESGDDDIRKPAKYWGTPLVSEVLQELYEQSKCTYPPQAVPIKCDPGCSFKCPDPYVKHGQSCVLSPSSGVKKKKRDSQKAKRGLHDVIDDVVSGLEEEVEDLFGAKCEWGLTKCGVLNSEWTGGSRFECVDTNSDLESCGGCAVPFSSRSTGPLGMDCTSIPGASDIECIRGTCAVRRCAKGWKVEPVAGSPTTLECVSKSA